MGDLLKLKLGDICQFKAGDAFKKDMQGRSFGNYPFVKVSDMNLAGNEIFITRAGNWVSESDVTERRFTAHQPGSIVFAKIGIALTYNRRRILRLPTIIDNNMMAARPDAKKVNERYFYYLLRTLDFNEISLGSALPYLTQKDLAEIDVALHPLPEQESIDATLSALDDKIELNRRMNETLEAMARALFKDWFVDFGPTRAKAESRDPYLAPEIWDMFPDALDDEDKPAGWAEIPLKKLGTVITGKTPSTKKPEFFGDDMPFLKIPDMRGKIYVLRTSTELSEDGVSSQKKKTLPPGSVSVSCIATPGLVIFNHQDTQTNQQINSLIPSDLRQSHFVFWSCRQLASAVMLGGSGGSVFHNMNKTSFENLRLVYPGEEIARMYSKTVSPMHNRMLSSEYQSDSLAQTRDLLLPKLMSGEIRVGDADKFAQEST